LKYLLFTCDAILYSFLYYWDVGLGQFQHGKISNKYKMHSNTASRHLQLKR